jgi:hypothetical protein
MDCFYCLSLWVAAPAALFVTTKPLDWLVVCLALSGAACLLERTKQDPLVIQPLPPNAEGDTDYGMLRTETSGARERPAGGGSAAASGPGESAGPASGPANSSHLPTASPTNGHGLDNGASLH